jgi:hypothetical protein
MTQALTGGCQCGRVRYTAEVDPGTAILCHCNMCKRATGGVSSPFVNVPREALTWHSEPDWYKSSPIARRGFCARCGTPLAFEFIEGATSTDLTIGSFDDPALFTPTLNYAVESMLSAWADVRHLPGQRSEDNEDDVRRWREAGLEPPE